jgi:hypothetical protein
MEFIHNSSTKFKSPNTSTTQSRVLELRIVGKLAGVNINFAQSFDDLYE